MSETDKSTIAAGRRIVLRDRLPSDLESQIRWRSQGEWLRFDAPWEARPSLVTDEAKENFRRGFLERCKETPPFPRQQATIAKRTGEPLGWVNRYAHERFPMAWSIGIDICEDPYLNQGIGTEALRLWVDYLFAHSDAHRLGIDTWSFNPRMVRVAEKLGFRFEGARREMLQWQGQWLDQLHYGMLRSEWQRSDDRQR